MVEEAVALLLLALFVGWAISFRPERGGKPQPAPTPRATRTAPAPFEPETATPAADRTVVRGAAYVVDGDTIRVRNTQIRLFGIDAPELDHPYGQRAKWALVGLCKGHPVRAEIHEYDAYGRTVARCFLPDGRDLSEEMVRLGLAIDWPKFSGGAYTAMEQPGVRRRLWLADARQRGRMDVWERFERQRAGSA